MDLERNSHTLVTKKQGNDPRVPKARKESGGKRKDIAY